MTKNSSNSFNSHKNEYYNFIFLHRKLIKDSVQLPISHEITNASRFFIQHLPFKYSSTLTFILCRLPLMFAFGKAVKLKNAVYAKKGVRIVVF